MKKASVIIFASAAALVLSSCAAEEPQEKPQQEKILSAAIARVQPAADTQLITAAGTVRLRRETELGFTSSGKVASVRYEEGDLVKRGTVLASLDASTVSADLDAAKAELERAELELARLQSLYKDGWVTKARLEQSEAAAKAARARVEASGFANRTSRITAPSGGIILSRNIDAGQVVQAGSPAIVLGETGSGYVLRVPMTDSEAARVRPGMRAKVIISALGQEPVDAIVSEKDGRADERTGTFEVSFRLPPNNRLRSGQLGSVEVELARGDEGTLAVPATAVFGLRSGEGLVFVVDAKNRVKQRNIVVGDINDDNLEIASGLKAGEIIVTRGVEKLRDGDKIKPVRTSQ